MADTEAWDMKGKVPGEKYFCIEVGDLSPSTWSTSSWKWCRLMRTMNASRNYSSAPECIILGYSQKVAGLERRKSLRLSSINQEVDFYELEKEDSPSTPTPLMPFSIWHVLVHMYWGMAVQAVATGLAWVYIDIAKLPSWLCVFFLFHR